MTAPTSTLTQRRPVRPEDRVRYLYSAYPGICPDRERALRQMFSHAAWEGGRLEWRGGRKVTWDTGTQVPRMTARFFPTPEWMHGWSSLLTLNPAAKPHWRLPAGSGLHLASRAWQHLALEAAAVHLRCDPAGQAQPEIAAVHDLLADHLGRPRWAGPVAPRLNWVTVHTVKTCQKQPPTARQAAVTADIADALVRDEPFDVTELEAKHAALDDTRLPPGAVWTGEETLITQGPWALLSFLRDADQSGRIRVTGQDAVALGLSLFAFKPGAPAADATHPLRAAQSADLEMMYAGVLDEALQGPKYRRRGEPRQARAAVTFTRKAGRVGFTARLDSWRGWTKWTSPQLPLAEWTRALTQVGETL